MEYKYFNLQRIVTALAAKYPYMISADLSPEERGKKYLYELYDNIMSKNLSIEDLPLYKNYLGKFDLEGVLGGFKLITPPECEGLLNDADYDLLQRFIFGSSSNTYLLHFDETTKTVELSICVEVKGERLTHKLQNLRFYQISRLFEIYFDEQASYGYQLYRDGEKEFIEEEREKHLVEFEMASNGSLPRQTSTNTLEELGNLLQPDASDEGVHVFTTYKTDDTFYVNGVAFKMVKVDGGSFQMGCGEENAEEDEAPVHTVKIRSFRMGETPVTQALWKAVMGENPSYFCSGNQEEAFDDDFDRPVEQVSWEDCQKFLLKLNDITGQRFRLPTEAEWEFAARGGNRSEGHPYSGSDHLDEVAWYWKNSGNTVLEGDDDSVDWNQMMPNQCRTHAVKDKAPNELGLYDMSGNVWEWCLDLYDDYDFLPQNNPRNLTSGFSRVLRGGSWGNGSGLCRVSNRHKDTPDNIYYLNGLRLCLPCGDETEIRMVIEDNEDVASTPELVVYPEIQVATAISTIQQEIESAARLVLSETLGLRLPSTIVLKFKPEELIFDQMQKSSEFQFAESDPQHLVFAIHGAQVKDVLENPECDSLKVNPIYMMFFAADLQMIRQENKLMSTLETDLTATSSENPPYDITALSRALNMFIHFREVGISLLGVCLLKKRQFGPVVNTLKQFSQIFEWTMIRSKMKIGEKTDDNELIDKKAWKDTFGVAPCVMLLVLEKCGRIDKALMVKAMKGLDSGNYDLSDAESGILIRAALSLSLFDYILGLMMLGDEIAPMQPFLKFCATLCHNFDQNNTKAFSCLVQQSANGQAFNDTMHQIVGNVMTEADIDKHYQDFCTKEAEENDRSDLKEKIDELYAFWKEEDDDNRKQIAQWALTYLFNDTDILNDDVRGFGYVDDMLVVDHAMNIILSDILKYAKKK